MGQICWANNIQERAGGGLTMGSGPVGGGGRLGLADLARLGLGAVQQKRPKAKRPRVRDDGSTGTGTARALVYRDGRARQKAGAMQGKQRRGGTRRGDEGRAEAVGSKAE